MATNEKMGDNRPVNLPGVYRHEEAKTEITTATGTKGYIQADAAVQVGYKRVGDFPKAKTETPKE